MSASTLYYAETGVEIHCGRVEDVLATIDPRTVALLLADPQYGNGKEGGRSSDVEGRPRKNSTAAKRAQTAVARKWKPIDGNDKPFDPAHLLALGRPSVLWGGNHYASRLPDEKGWIAWDKRDGMDSDDGSDMELAWTNLGGALRVFRHAWRGLARASEGGTPHLHPTQKPVALGAWVLQRAKVKAGDLVVVPYAGSGPDVIACRNAGVRVIAIECVEAYCEVIKQRLVKAPIFPMFAPPPIVTAEQGPDLFSFTGAK